MKSSIQKWMVCGATAFGSILVSSCTTRYAQQLTEISGEIKSIKSELAQVRQAVTEIHRATISPPSMAAPKPAIGSVELDDDPSLGAEDAPVGIVEFSDYQCPFCRRFHVQVFPQIKRAYLDTGKIRYVYRDLPLNFHAEAKLAAIAANCAGATGKYWQLSEKLFESQEKLGNQLYKELAVQLGLPSQAFKECLTDEKQAKEVESDVAYAQTLGVSGTPTFFVGRIREGKLVNAKIITGAQPYEAFANAIDSFLTK